MGKEDYTRNLIKVLRDATCRRNLASTIQFSRIHGLLRRCEVEGHCRTITPGTAGLASSPGPEDLFVQGFRLIDIEQMMLVAKTIPCDYVALSYIWGPYLHDHIRTFKLTVDHLGQPNALAQGLVTFDKRLPHTIKNAIVACRRVCHRYLWADMLGIVQDDPDEKKRLNHNMDRVFEGAAVTIIALAGSDAEAGLPGLQSRVDPPLTWKSMALGITKNTIFATRPSLCR